MCEIRTAVVVDDEPITCMDVAEMLREMGFDVVGEAADGFDAVELCRVHRPDLVLMDARMPVFDGLTASKTILEKQLHRSAHGLSGPGYDRKSNQGRRQRISCQAD